MPNPSLIPPAPTGYFSPVLDLSRNMGRIGTRGMAGNMVLKPLSPEEEATLADVGAKATTTAEAVAPLESVQTAEDGLDQDQIRLERLRLLLEAGAPKAMSQTLTQPKEKQNATG